MQNKIVIPIILAIFVMAAIAAYLVYQKYKTHHLTLATAAEEGEYYKFGEKLSELIARHEPKIELEIESTDGSLDNLLLLNSDEVDLAIVQNSVLTNRLSKGSIRAVASLFPEVVHLIVASEANIEDLSDLKGKRVGRMKGGSGSYDLFVDLIRHYDLTEDDFEKVEFSPKEVIHYFQERKIDALCYTLALGNDILRQLLHTDGVKLISIDQVAAMKISRPYIEEDIIPRGTYSAAPAIPEKNLQVASVRAMLLARYDVEEELIHKITRILYEHRGELATYYPLASAINSPDSKDSHVLSLPVHPGSDAFYNQDKPSILVEYAEVFALGLSLIGIFASGAWRLHQNQKNRADKHNLDILGLIEQVQTIDDLKRLQEIREKLLLIFHKVIVDYDNDEITPESFQSFSFPLDFAINTIRHREIMLKDKGSQANLSGES